MSKIAVVVNSTTSLPKEYVEAKDNLYVLPLPVMFDDESYLDGVDITSVDFYNRMKTSDIMPTTSQPPIGSAIELFEELIKQYDEVIYLTLTSAFSGAYSTGVIAANSVDGDRIHVIDSKSVSVIEGYFAREIVRLTEEGKSVDAIIAHIDSLRDKWNILLVVEDLNHLYRGGRIGRAAATIGTALKLKPVLRIDEDGFSTQDKIRTTKKAYQRMVDILMQDDIDENTVIFIAHTEEEETAKEIQGMINERVTNQVNIEVLTPVIGAHTGTNSVGIAWIKL